MASRELTESPSSARADNLARPALAPGEKLLRLPSVLEMTGRGRTAWLEDVKASRAPKPIKIGSATFWVLTEIQAYIADRIRESRAG